jgi:hypothetical protein
MLSRRDKEDSMKIKVIDIFRDKFTGEVYSPGTILDFEDEARIQDLENRKLAERVETVKTPEEKKEVKISLFDKEFEKKVLIDALKSIGAQASGNMKEETLLAKVSELDEESIAKLKVTLGIEA